MVLFTDTGFQAEFDAMREILSNEEHLKFKFSIINLERKGCDFKNDSRETVFSKSDDVSQFKISNNSGLAELEDSVKETIMKILGPEYEIYFEEFVSQNR